MALQPRKIGESKAQYDRRVGKRPPRTIGRPATTGRLRVPPTKARPKPIAKPTPVTVIGKKPPTQKVKAKVDPDRRIPRPKRPTVDPKKPLRTKRPPKNLKDFVEELKRRAKDKPKRPRQPDKKMGYTRVNARDAITELGFKPPKGVATMALETFHNPTTGQIVTVPSGGYTAPKGFIKGSPTKPFKSKQIPIPRPTPTLRPPIKPPTNNVEKFLAGRKPNELNRQDKIRFQKELYKFNQERSQRDIDQARQQIINRFKNDPARLQFEIGKLDRNVKMGNTVEKFKAGMVGVDALKKIGIPARLIDQLTFERKMFLTPDSPAKLDTILKRRLFQANRNYRDQYKRMIRQGASRGDILRMQRAFRENMRRMREGFAREKAKLQNRNINIPRSPRSFASIFGPR
tara:strand:- start:8349 stop:9554 length:1206 start_codon:yes stop_codon:yes gene_type:complete